VFGAFLRAKGPASSARSVETGRVRRSARWTFVCGLKRKLSFYGFNDPNDETRSSGGIVIDIIRRNTRTDEVEMMAAAELNERQMPRNSEAPGMADRRPATCAEIAGVDLEVAR
jgi:hypothetical protein